MLFKEKIKCPYCDEVLEKKPSRKVKCPFCKNYIYVKQNKLMKKDEADALDEKHKIKYKMVYFGMSEKDYYFHKNKLAKKRGFEPEYFDIIWDLLNEKTMELANDKNFNELSLLYYKMALFLNEEGKDFSHVLQQSRKTELENMKAMGIKKVEIMSIGGCLSCKELNGKKFTIKEALDTMPIPNKNCLNEKFNNFCRCIYQPIIKRD